MITAKGIVQLWTVQKGGHYSLRQESRGSQNMVAAIKKADPDLERLSDETFEVLDFDFVPSLDPADDSRMEEGEERRSLLILAAYHQPTSATYVLFEVSVAPPSSLTVGLVYSIRSYATLPPPGSQWKPKLLFPHPPHTAFVVFDKAVVVVSLAKGADSPEEQILQDNHRFPKVFEDVVDLRKNGDVAILGCGSEDGPGVESSSTYDATHRRRSQHPACLVLVKSVGLVRIAATSSSTESSVAEQPGVTVKSKVEQAISYGIQPHNPLEFSVRSEMSHPQEEVEEAALAISTEILNSSSKAVPYLTPSLEHQLSQRATALRELASYVKANFPPLSRVTKWRLLWDAEKLAGAREIWRRHDANLKRRSSDPETVLLAELVDMLHERNKDIPNPQKGELDKVRHWFTKDIGKLEIVVPWGHHVLNELYDEGKKRAAQVAELMSQANDVFLGALQTAVTFRQKNAPLYGLEDEPLEEGLLPTHAYKGLPQFWTSDPLIVSSSKYITDVEQIFCARYLVKSISQDAPDHDTITNVINENPAMVQLCCRTFVERIRWSSVQPNAELRGKEAGLKKLHVSVRRLLFRQMVPIGLVDSAIELSEKYEDMKTLVELIGAEMSTAAANAGNAGIPAKERSPYEKRVAMLQDRFVSYFKRFGDKWASALFTYQIRHGDLAGLMDDNDEWQSYLTKFLRANPAYAKLSWINDVLGEKDFGTASRALSDVAAMKERDVWSKKVEMSLGKLSLLAAQAGNKDGGVGRKTEVDERVARVDQGFLLIEVQEKLYQHIAPSIREAIDETAELDLVKKDFGSQVTKDQPALSTVLEQGLASLVTREPMSAEMLIDVLTLIDHHYDLEYTGPLTGQEFYLALRLTTVIRTEDVAKATLLERLIWRRWMIRDDWVVINDTQLKDDQMMEQSTGNTALHMNVKAGFESGES